MAGIVVKDRMNPPLKQNGVVIPSKDNFSILTDKLEKVIANDEDDNNNNNNNNSVAINHEQEAQYFAENEDFNKTCTPIQDFYKDAVIFITGGTGFLGKILINKLLRCCPDIETIYLLVRSKKGKDIYTRLDEIFEDAVFDQMKQEVPKYRHKIEIVQGDVSLAGLGLSLADRQMLFEKINIVFHAAATVRFDERLDLALAINVEGVHSMIDLCKNMKKLKSLVHVSTCYTNCFRKGPVKECFYDYNVTYEDVRNKICKLDYKAIEKVTPGVLGPWPNTYTFTKALAEDCIRKKTRDLPIGMFRPAIVTSTFSDPVEGWIDNVYGPTGVIAGAASGILRTLHCNEKLNANVVPVDLCVNALIASAWDIANNCNDRKGDKMLIYNYVSTAENPLTWKEFCYYNCTYGFKYPLGSAVWYYALTLNKYYYMDKLYAILFHYIPASIVDVVCVCVGQKPRMLKMYGKIQKFASVISYFCTNEWDFSNDNVRSLWRKLNKSDQRMFPFNIKDVNWLHYFSFYLRGMRTYLFKEKMPQEEAIRKWNRFYYYHVLLKTILISSLSYGLWSVLFKAFFSRSS